MVKKWTKKCLFRLFFLLDWPSVNLSFSDALNTIHGFVLFFRSGLVEGLTFIFSWFARFGHKEIQKSGFFGRLLEVQFFSWTLASLEFDFSLLRITIWVQSNTILGDKSWVFFQHLGGDIFMSFWMPFFCIIGEIRHGERSTWKMNKHFTFLVNKFLVSSPSPKKNFCFCFFFLKNVTCCISTS